MAAADKYRENAEHNELAMNDAAQDQEFQIDLVELFFRLLEKAWLIIVVGMIAAVISGVYTQFFVEETYKSTTKLYVVNSGDSAIDLTSLNIGDKLADDYVQVFKNRDVYDKVKSGLEMGGVVIDYTYEEMQSMMNVSVISDTRIIQLSVTCNDPVEAEQIVSAYAAAAASFIANTMKTDEPTVFERARQATEPSGPNMLRNVILAFMIGALLMAAIVIVQFIMDDRIRTVNQLEKHLGLPTLGMMPVQDSDRKSRRRAKEGK